MTSPEHPRGKIVKIVTYMHLMFYSSCDAFHVSGFPAAAQRVEKPKPSRAGGKCWPMKDKRQEETDKLFSVPVSKRLFWNECFHMAYPETNQPGDMIVFTTEWCALFICYPVFSSLLHFLFSSHLLSWDCTPGRALTPRLCLRLCCLGNTG